MTDLKTSYLGLSLENPLVVSASPLTKRVSTAKKLEEAGAAAVVMYSLFEEEIIHESLALNSFLNRGTDLSAEAQTSFPDFEHYNTGPEGYIKHLAQLKKELKIPVIASLNGATPGGWVNYARLLQSEGADALELNFYSIPTSLMTSAADLEKRYLQIVREVRSEITIPLSVKLSTGFTALPHFASQVIEAGATGLVLFNRFIQPDFDLDNLEVVPNLVLSTSDEIRQPLRWTAILHGKIQADIALSGGVHTGKDIAKAILAGASVAMSASELVEKGPARASSLLEELTGWMNEHEYQSVKEMKGAMSQKSVSDPTAFERGNYMKALISYDNKQF